MFETLITNALDALEWKKDKYEPYFNDLIEREITAETVEQWLLDWTKIGNLVYEVYSRLEVATTIDTTDEKSDKLRRDFMDNVLPAMMITNNVLNKKLLESGLEPDGLEVPMRNIRGDAALFRENNIPLFTEESKIGMEYDKISGSQTVEWEGQEVTLAQLAPIGQEQDRNKREKAWRLAAERRRQDRDAQNDLWTKYMVLRGKVADNANMPDYRAYKWQDLHRFDYSPEDNLRFLDAIEKVAVPAATKIYEKRRTRLGIEKLRPWDLQVDPLGLDPLRPYETIEQMEATTESIFNKVDPQLGEYFNIMRKEKLLDLDNRKGKASGGYCTFYSVVKRPFIFMNAVGLHGDVQTLLHEGGHSFHVFENEHLPYIQQYEIPMEFAEVASMAMELLTAPYLAKSEGGFYTDEEAARARVEHLEGIITFWPYMAVVDTFQHWIYTNHTEATDPDNCDTKWTELWERFMPDVDYSGIEDFRLNRWRRQLHIFQVPFYYIEYGLAQLGAVQVWAKSLENQKEAIRNYRKALSLGATSKLPDLFATAGAKLDFDAKTLKEALELVETTIHQLDPA
jgi:oligoendopeptidase F